MAELDVLIPHYNDVAGIAISLNCVASQTWSEPIRVVIQDDGSPQGVMRALEELSEKCPFEVHLVRSPINRGRAHTRNKLLDLIDSPYVAWLDAGDEWYPNKVATQMAALKGSGIEDEGWKWVTCHYDWNDWNSIGAKSREVRSRQVRQVTEQDQIRALLSGGELRAYLWTILCKAESLKDVGRFDERLGRLQDLDYFIRFVLKGGRLVDPGVDSSLCAYNKTDRGRCANEVRDCYEYVFAKHRPLYSRYGSEFTRGCRYQMEMQAARFASNNGETRTKFAYMLRALRVAPRRFGRHVLTRGLRP